IANKSLFQAGTEPTLTETRKRFGKQLKEDKAEYHGVVIESFVTPRREVSLHRAAFADYAVYSNSPVAVRRVIDAHQGKGKRFAPDGNTVFWDHEAQVAVSNIWNTQDFVTPLIEVPINQVTPTEAREYERFRLEYLGLWRQYFDPIGMRLSLGKEQVRMELY